MSKILIVDDSKELQEALQLFLTKKGYEVLCTESGKNLLPIIKELLPDMIFLDVFLQGEDGREICKELRNNSETKYLCIILISGSPKDLQLYKEFGADGYLEKPFALPVLLDKIESTLGKCKDK